MLLRYHLPSEEHAAAGMPQLQCIFLSFSFSPSVIFDRGKWRRITSAPREIVCQCRVTDQQLRTIVLSRYVSSPLLRSARRCETRKRVQGAFTVHLALRGIPVARVTRHTDFRVTRLQRLTETARQRVHLSRLLLCRNYR